MKTKCFLWASILCTLLDGCKVVSTSQVPTNHKFPDSNGKPSFVVHGMPYFLPIGLITIKGDWKDPADHKEPAADHVANLQSGLTFGFLAAGSASPSSKDTSGDASAGQTATLVVDGWTITITAEAEADPGQMFYAVPRRNYIFDDDFQVTVNSKHLLSAGKSTANDRTADVIGAVASMIPAFAGVETKGRGAPPKLKSFLVSFRTDSENEYEAARKVLHDAGFGLAPLSTPAPANPEALSTGDQEQGLVFRLAEPYTVSMTYPVDAAPALNYKHVFVLPGLQPYVLEYHRVAFVKKVQEVGFTDGMLTDYHENLPSPILGVLGIPKAIVGAIVPLVGGGSLGGSGTTPAAPPPTVTP
jgi:hypothetical protein